MPERISFRLAVLVYRCLHDSAPGLRSSARVTPQRTSMTALFDYISAGRSTHCAFYHWRPHLSSDCCISLEQFPGVGPVVSVVASFPQQTENWTFCPILQTWLRTSHCTDYYYVTSLFKLIVTCPCSLRTQRHAKVNSSFIIIIIINNFLSCNWQRSQWIVKYSAQVFSSRA